MTSSLDDLLDWGQALYSGQLLGPALTERMLRLSSNALAGIAVGLATLADA